MSLTGRPVNEGRGASPAGRSSGYPRAPQPAVFIDKDGTLIENISYNVDPDRVRFTRHALPALQRLAEAGFALFIATNQPGLATGRFTPLQFARLQQGLQRRLFDEAGLTLAGWCVCPHAPAADGAPACGCRKPAPGMLLRAAQAHGIDLQRSWMVGDILDDVEAGRRAGCRAVLLDVGNETVWHMTPWRMPTHRVPDLAAAAAAILEESDVALRAAPAPRDFRTALRR